MCEVLGLKQSTPLGYLYKTQEKQKGLSWGWGDGSVVKSNYYSDRGPEFSSQHPYQVAYNYLLLQVQKS